MLQDPIKLGRPASDDGISIDGSTVVEFALIPSNVPGRTVRVGVINGMNARLTVQHSETKENKPFGTDRLNVRLDLTKVGSDGKAVEGFFQSTSGFPKAVFTDEDMQAIREYVSIFSAMGDTHDEGGTFSVTLVAGDLIFKRLSAGEG